jgi:8-oxo-dGTP pyrophosphatase MutT (NUDIX family)
MNDARPLTPLSRLPHFDPRAVPVTAVDHHLPAVDDRALTAQALVSRFALPPDWAPELSIEPRYSDRSAMAASVLVPIVQRAEPTLLLTQRTSHLSTHSGQIAFPGGKRDAQDVDLVATAVREAQEEVGLAPDHLQVLGQLPVYVTGTRFIVTPVVALVRPGFELQPNSDEVAAVFEVPLRFLMNPANHRWHRFEAEGVTRQWLSIPYQDGADERFIWGATAGMLRNLYRFLSA